MGVGDKVKEDVEVVSKAWGEEVIIVNNGVYCGKLLRINRGGQSSLHYHSMKMETFYCLDGQVELEVGDKKYQFEPYSTPKTIQPGIPHRFRGITRGTLLEISTHHDDSDVVRLSKSKVYGMVRGKQV